MTITTLDRWTVDYCRISYDKRGAAEGVGTQHVENENSADELGLTIAQTYTDNDLSAFSGIERPDYQRMIEDIEAGKIGTLIIRHADRLHRSVEEVSRFIKVARAHDVKLYSGMKGSFYNLNKAAGRKDLINDTLNAEYESDHRGERVSDARKRQARNGDYGGGVRPFGWGVDTGRVRSMCVNPKAPVAERRYEDRPVLDMSRHSDAEAAEIRRWADDLLSGVSMRQVLADLADRGVKTVAEADGRNLRRNGRDVKHEGWNSRTIKQILTHPRTSGHAVHHGEIVKRNAFEPIIPEEKRQALITLFTDPTRKTAPGNTPKWLGSLIYRCGVCDDGTFMTARKNSRGTFVYRCREKGHCSRIAAEADGFVESVMIERLSRADVADLLPQRVSVDVNELRDRLRELDAEETDVAIRAAQKKITAVMMEVFSAEIERQRDEIRKQLNDATAESPLAEFVGADDSAKVWHGLSLGRKREIIRLLTPVTLMPVPAVRGRGFDPASVRFDAWQGAREVA